MKSNSPKGRDEDASGMLRLAERNLARALAELDATVSELEARSDGAHARSKIAAADVRKAIQTVFDERHRLEKLEESNGTAARSGELDLDAARLEIGRRLARLRQRGGSGEASGGAE